MRGAGAHDAFGTPAVARNLLSGIAAPHYGVEVDLFSHTWTALRAAVADLSDEDFGRPSGCTGWLVRDLVCHLIVDAQDPDHPGHPVRPGTDARRSDVLGRLRYSADR